MKKLLFSLITILCGVWQLSAQITAPGVKWSDSYSFDRYNEMKIDFFAKGDELMRTYQYKTWYTGSDAEVTTTTGGLKVPKGNFCVLMDAPQKGSDIETIFDMTNEVAVQIFGSDAAEPMYNAGGFKFPEGEAIKKLELVPTDETRTIAGHTCKKYTYVYKKIFGSAWITAEVKLPNDYGIFRAAKMAALHNTLSGEGFVMEMTSEDAKGGKTVMTTVALGKSEKRTITLPRAKMGTAINKVNYFTF
jgi:hypothetical protein